MAIRLSVIGTGYLGATHAACMAELGFEVLGVDSNPDKVAALAAGDLPFSEPGLDVLLREHVATGRLRFSTSLREAALFGDVHFICVGTPQAPSGKAADVGAVFSVVQGLASHLTRDALIVGKSTVPVGTCEALNSLVDAVAPRGLKATVVWNPEFLREGYAVQDTLTPDRLVFGIDPGVADVEATLRNLYAQPIAAGTPVHVTDPATAELAKVAANSFLATKISFINAMAEVSERAGADVVALADILGDDSRIGRRFLDAGVGFGGGCLPKDIRAFATRAAELGAPSVARLLDEVDQINLDARRRTVRAAVDLCGGRVKRKRIAVLGAAFKPNSDDVRDSPALAVAGQLQLQGASVRVFDPEATNNARAVQPGLTYVANVEAALRGADLVLHLTEWQEFREIDPVHAATLMRSARVLDGRNKLDLDQWRAAGFEAVALGRGRGATQTTQPVDGALAATGTDALTARARLRARLTRA